MSGILESELIGLIVAEVKKVVFKYIEDELENKVIEIIKYVTSSKEVTK